MANISLKSMLEASIDPKLVARSKKTGKLVYFKTPQAKDAAMKAGSHEQPKKDKKAQAKQAAQSANLFKGDYSKERELPTNDFSDIKGPKPGDSGWSTEDVFNATFKDPETGKTITVGDAYDREDGSPAYEKAFAYAAEFNPDDEELISGPGSGDDFSNIKGPKPDDSGWSTEDVFNATFKDPKTGKTITVGDAYDREDDSEAYNIALDYVSQFNPDDEELISGPGSPSKKTDSNLDISPKNWKTEPNGGMKFAAAMELEKILNSELGVDGAADIGDNNGAIEYVIDDNDRETSLYLGKSKDGYDVSIANPYSDEFEEPKVFKTPEEAVKYAIELAKKYKKDLGAKNESVKLKNLLPKK